MTKVLSMIASLLAIAGILIGGPILLVLVGRLDLLFTIDWGSVLRVPDDGSLVLLALTIVGWVAWVLVAASLVTEAIAVITSGRIRLQVPGTRWFKPASAALVAASIGLIIGATSPATDQPVKAADTTPAPTPTAVASVEPSAETTADATPSAAASSYIVQPGDDLWSLAERFLGMGERWREIADLNDTTILKITDELAAGTVLHLPADAVQPSDDAPPETVTVQAGDSLWGLAEEHLGDGHRWPEIYEANRDVIADPDLIDIGWTLTLPGSTPVDAAIPGEAPDESPETPAQPLEAPPSSAAPAEATEPATDGPLSATAALIGADAASTFMWPSNSALLVETTGTSVSGSTTELPRTSSQMPAEATFDVDAELFRRIGAIGGGLAVALAGALQWRRRRQLVERDLGRKIALPLGELADVEQALQVAGALQRVPQPPGHVVVGWHLDGSQTVVDLESAVVTSVTGDPDDVSATLAAIAAELLADEVHVIAVGKGLMWLESLEHAQLSATPSRDDGLTQLASAVSLRLAALVNGQTVADLRASDDVAEAWQPIVAVVDGPLDLAPSLVAQMKRVGVSAVCAGEVGAAGQTIALSDDIAMLQPQGETFEAQMISAPARRALIELFDVTGSTETTPAPWWAHDGAAATVVGAAGMGFPIVREESLVAEITNAHHPRLFILGPVTIEGARGPVPPRALKQCAEYCGYLLTHPGATAPEMSRDLFVAESTRRSNMSRLRTWLGNDHGGQPYLPDAYTGRIHLHPGVSSDWEHLLTLISGGVNRTSTTNLAAALSLVRGAPLADAAPGQWHWAEELRTTMVSVIRDIGVVLADRYLEADDTDGARWAASRALRAAPEDEQLMAARIRTEHRLGNAHELERLVLHVTRHARMVGVDLKPETVTVLQKVMEGTVRARNV